MSGYTTGQGFAASSMDRGALLATPEGIAAVRAWEQLGKEDVA